ncbi:MAG: cytochrome o ubiquinol oxidase subunit I, partial [Acidiferrobacter sp.]
TPSPVPFYNFAVTPRVHARDEFVWRKEQGFDNAVATEYEDIPMPKNTSVPLLIGAFAFSLGFGLVWRIWWLTDASLLAIIMVVIARSFVRSTDYVVKADEVERLERDARSGRGRPPKADSMSGGIGTLNPSRPS